VMNMRVKRKTLKPWLVNSLVYIHSFIKGV
jgi:hypothetical protein